MAGATDLQSLGLASRIDGLLAPAKQGASAAEAVPAAGSPAGTAVPAETPASAPIPASPANTVAASPTAAAGPATASAKPRSGSTSMEATSTREPAGAWPLLALGIGLVALSCAAGVVVLRLRRVRHPDGLRASDRAAAQRPVIPGAVK